LADPVTGQRQPRNSAHHDAQLVLARRTVRQFLTEWDPVGVGAAAADDRHDQLANILVERLNAGTDTVTLGYLLRQEIRRLLGVRIAGPDTDDVAARLIAWWAALTPAQQRHKPDSSPPSPPPRTDSDSGHAVVPPNLDEYAHLWDGSDPGWVILADPTEPGRSGLPFNLSTRMAISICEDEDLADAVLQAMRTHGVPVVPAASVRDSGGAPT
jgi:hypothetical protein